MDPLVARDLGEFVRAIFLDTENAVAVLSSGPSHSREARPRGLSTGEMAAIRALFDRFAGSGRLLNHAIIHVEIPEEIEAMEPWRDEFHPVGWKVYTMGHRPDDFGTEWREGYQLDDEERGLPFLERARDLGVRLVCAHKGLSGFVDNGSPRDIGPAARIFPDLDFVVYHSGFEFPAGIGNAADVAPTDPGALGEEGPYNDEFAEFGVNRLLRTLEHEGLGRNCNVYAELGTTWFCLVRRPREAAHVLGKLIKHLGEDNVIWGTDSIWYGAAQPLIDAFRVFQIPDDMCEQFGYSKITAEMRAKILGTNAGRLYGIDIDKAREVAKNDDLSWARQLLRELREDGLDPLA
jgi:predicted TIM-barrel fold metal-dependent hydrolase